MDTNQLISDILKGNKLSERKLFDAYANRVIGVCNRYAKDEHQAKDYFQECWIVLFNKLGKFNPEKGKFEYWMVRVCTNEIFGMMRKDKKVPTSQATDLLPEASMEEKDFDQVSNLELIEAIQKLPEGYKKVLNLFVFEKWSHKDIANKLNINEASSRSQYARAKKLLKKILVQSIPDIYERRLV